MRRNLIVLLLCAFLVSLTLAVPIQGNTAAPESKLREPLPLDVTVSLRGHNGRSSLQFSSNSKWLVHTVETADTMASGEGRYSLTGMPFAEGSARMEATLTDVQSGESLVLGSTTGSSWAPAFSPDGSKVAFYSDEDGEAGLWILDVGTREKERVPGIIARPFFGFEAPAWSSDGKQIVLKVLEEGSSLSDANQAVARSFGRAPSRFPEVEDGEASVIVRRVDPPEPEARTASSDLEALDEPADDPTVQKPPVGDMNRRRVDLAVVNVASNRAKRVVHGEAVGFYAFSPDASRIAYSVIKGVEPATQQPNYDLRLLDLGTGEARVVGENLRLGYGIEWSWSPDGRHLAYIPTGQMARRAAAAGSAERIVLIRIADGGVINLGKAETPSLDPGDGELPPYWSADGTRLFALAEGEVWTADLESREVRKLAGLDGWRIRALIVDRPTAQVWSGSRKGWLWAVARDTTSQRSSIWRIDEKTGAAMLMHEEAKSFYGTFNVAGAPSSSEIAFVATGLREPADIWVMDSDSGDVRQASHLNRDLERYELGTARLIGWRGLDGEALRGALLLPPGYDKEVSAPLPLVVWVYGGSMGSRSINRFGLWGSSPSFNMHVLATRGFAVLFPDAPVRIGTPIRDLMATVIPGVNAAIDGGWADPERLAIMGQSYGSFNTLGIISRTTRFRAAIITAVVLHPDLFADYLRNVGYYEQGQGNMGGTIWEVPDRFRENSPLFHFDRIETPLLIGQGENDGDLEPAEAIFSALERLEKPVEYRLYEGEGHVLNERANVIDFWNRRLAFLVEHLDLEMDSTGRARVAAASEP